MVRKVAIIVAFGLSLTSSMAGQFKWNWKETQELSWHENLKTSKLSETERTVVKRALLDLIAAELSSENVSDIEIDKTALDTRIQMVDLNGDRTPEVIAQGSSDKFCSPTGNCPLWILQKSGGKYIPLLKAF